MTKKEVVLKLLNIDSKVLPNEDKAEMIEAIYTDTVNDSYYPYVYPYGWSKEYPSRLGDVVYTTATQIPKGNTIVEN